jgi:CubicO group peptidase (beta-lactamase class C family)
LLLATASTLQAQDLRAFDAYANQSAKDWGVPGLAVAIVKDDKIVFAKGYGVRTLGRPEPVDEHSLFAVGSTTKAMTAFALALLVEEGKVKWDDPVVKHLPAFQLSDPYMTRQLTVRDLLTHRTGIGNADYLWYATPYDWNEIFRRMRYITPASSMRSQYVYQNLMYATAGAVVAAASGMPWDEFVKRRILEPLGMRETLTGMRGLDAQPNVAMPHLDIDDTVRTIRYRNLDNIAPAGAVNSSVADMAKWIRFQLDSARLGGKRLVAASIFDELFTPQFVVPMASYYPGAKLAGAHFTAYGLGWFLQDYRGRKVAMHTGSIDGMTAIIGMLPEERMGVIVLANLDHAEVRHALMYRAFDLYLGGPQRDWSSELKKVYGAQETRARNAERQRDARRVMGTRPSLALDAYTGTYSDSLYGTAVVRVEDGTLVVDIGPYFHGVLEHWNYDTFRARWSDPALGRSLLTFTLDATGRVDAVSWGPRRLRRER